MNQQITYIDFHLKFLGYSFKSYKTGLVYSKQTMWDRFNQICVNDVLMDKDYVKGFMKVDSEGWKDGKLIES